MRLTDRDQRPECHVIPFNRPEIQPEEVAATSIAAVIAVTVLHTSSESPEDRLLAILEQSGEVEISGCRRSAWRLRAIGRRGIYGAGQR